MSSAGYPSLLPLLWLLPSSLPTSLPALLPLLRRPAQAQPPGDKRHADLILAWSERGSMYGEEIQGLGFEHNADLILAWSEGGSREEIWGFGFGSDDAAWVFGVLEIWCFGDMGFWVWER